MLILCRSELPDPLLTYKLFSSFTKAGEERDELVKIEAFRRSVFSLPAENLMVLGTLLDFFVKILRRSELHQLPSTTIAGLFGPLLLREPTIGLQEGQVNTSYVPAAIQVVKYLVQKSSVILLKVFLGFFRKISCMHSP